MAAASRTLPVQCQLRSRGNKLHGSSFSWGKWIQARPRVGEGRQRRVGRGGAEAASFPDRGHEGCRTQPPLPLASRPPCGGVRDGWRGSDCTDRTPYRREVGEREELEPSLWRPRLPQADGGSSGARSLASAPPRAGRVRALPAGSPSLSGAVKVCCCSWMFQFLNIVITLAAFCIVVNYMFFKLKWVMVGIKKRTCWRKKNMEGTNSSRLLPHVHETA